MLELPDVTIILLTNRDWEGAKKAIDKSCEKINFGGKKIIWDEKCDSIDKWNYKMIYELPFYVTTSHALIIHQDSKIINPHLWNNKWLEYDYCGSPWPLPKDDYSYRSESGELQRVGNSVSLRSSKLMYLAAMTLKSKFWGIKERYGNTNEDGFICCHNREWLEAQGCKFIPFEEAIYFGKEHELPENKDVDTFLVHQVDL